MRSCRHLVVRSSHICRGETEEVPDRTERLCGANRVDVGTEADVPCSHLPHQQRHHLAPFSCFKSTKRSAEQDEHCIESNRRQRREPAIDDAEQVSVVDEHGPGASEESLDERCADDRGRAGRQCLRQAVFDINRLPCSAVVQESRRSTLHKAVDVARRRELIKHRREITLPGWVSEYRKRRLHACKPFDHHDRGIVIELPACHGSTGEDADDDAVEHRTHR